MNLPSPWREDKAFLVFAREHWGDDLDKASQGGYPAQSATTRLLHRWQCYVLLTGQSAR